MFHPAEGFYALKHERRGNIASAFLLVALETGAYVFIRQYAGFLFNEVDISRFSALAEAARVVVPFILWCWVNWCLTTLLDGKGSMHDIVVSTAQPSLLVVVLVPATMLSNCLILEEAFCTTGVGCRSFMGGRAAALRHFDYSRLHAQQDDFDFGPDRDRHRSSGFHRNAAYVVVSQVAVFVSDIYTEVTFRL